MADNQLKSRAVSHATGHFVDQHSPATRNNGRQQANQNSIQMCDKVKPFNIQQYVFYCLLLSIQKRNLRIWHTHKINIK